MCKKRRDECSVELHYALIAKRENKDIAKFRPYIHPHPPSRSETDVRVFCRVPEILTVTETILPLSVLVTTVLLAADNWRIKTILSRRHPVNLDAVLSYMEIIYYILHIFRMEREKKRMKKEYLGRNFVLGKGRTSIFLLLSIDGKGVGYTDNRGQPGKGRQGQTVMD